MTATTPEQSPHIKIWWEDLEIGQVRDLGSLSPTKEEIIAFASQFDPQPFHLDEEAGRASVFGALSASGWHTCAMAMRLMVTNFLHETSSLGSPGLESLKWTKPVYPGDVLRLQHTITEKRAMSKRPDVGLVRTVWECSTSMATRYCTWRATACSAEGRLAPQARHECPLKSADATRAVPSCPTMPPMDFKPLITLRAIVNPLAIVPFFIHYTQGFSSAQRRRTILISSISAFAVIATCAIICLQILEFFGISLASFQVGGGMLLLTSALSMLNAQPAEAKTTQGEVDDASARASIAVVPLTIPLLTGPATMSTVVIYADQAKTFFQHAALVGYGVVIALATAVCFSLAKPIARLMGQTGINVMTRLMGLILAALAVGVMAAGLTKLFPALGQ